VEHRTRADNKVYGRPTELRPGSAEAVAVGLTASGRTDGRASVEGETAMVTRVAAVALSIGLVLTIQPSQPASANGAAFFADPNRIAEDSTLYFGIVKDQKGTPVVGASVEIHIKGQNIEYVYQTTSLGRYR